MKHSFLARFRMFLENHIAVILALFIPVWLGILFAMVVVLELLPKEIARKLEPQGMNTAFVILATLVVCAVIAILRMVRDITDGISRRPIIYLLVLDIIIMFFIYDTSAALQLKQDNADITSNLSRISKRLYAYQEEHGSYPPQQDLESLLETLGLRESDFYRTAYFDIHSAEYHAPAGDSNDPEDRLVTLRVKDHLRFVRRDGSVGNEHLKDKTPPPVPKHEKERSAAIPEPDDEKQ